MSYIRLYLNRTRSNYRKILSEALEETKKYCDQFPSITIYLEIYNQLIDIQEVIINQNEVFSENELYKRYTLGAIASKNFDLEHEIYAQKLSDVFGGTFDYAQMPDA